MRSHPRPIRPAGAWVVVAALAAGPLAAQDLPFEVRPAPAQPAPAQPAAPAPASEIDQLVKQLGHDDFRVREAATKRLRDIGKPAVAALRRAATGRDPEVCSRADALLRQIQRPRIPPHWFTNPNLLVRRVQTNMNGTRVVELEEGGRRLRVGEGPGGIEMTLTGVDDGEVINTTFRARDADELRRTDPDAYALYVRCSGLVSGGVMRGRRLLVPPPAPNVQLLPLAPAARPPADNLQDLEQRLRRDMGKAGVDAEAQLRVLSLMKALRDLQAEGALGVPQDLEVKVRKYNELSDALRKALADAKVPDPGDALPPPARARLGVSVAPPVADDAAGVPVTSVLPGSRGEKLGLKEGDVIDKVNGKAVHDAAGLRRVLMDANEPLSLDVTRDGERLTLREAAPKAR